MMPDLGTYAGEIYAAYGFCIVMLVGIVAVSVRAARRSKVLLDQAEKGAERG